MRPTFLYIFTSPTTLICSTHIQIISKVSFNRFIIQFSLMSFRFQFKEFDLSCVIPRPQEHHGSNWFIGTCTVAPPSSLSLITRQKPSLLQGIGGDRHHGRLVDSPELLSDGTSRLVAGQRGIARDVMRFHLSLSSFVWLQLRGWDIRARE